MLKFIRWYLGFGFVSSFVFLLVLAMSPTKHIPYTLLVYMTIVGVVAFLAYGAAYIECDLHLQRERDSRGSQSRKG